MAPFYSPGSRPCHQAQAIEKEIPQTKSQEALAGLILTVLPVRVECAQAIAGE
ncbi:MAG: hypothetical protein SFV17_08210 [Candidatus Obscuribacter sp.]|nr:hypothetical protein [Candidatus Melainabacteria bacterium]MDX1986655.1 hypothetical protein [Candidatus Obscuribacter sp.]